MKINQKSTGAFACLGLLLGLALVGMAGCSSDSSSDSTPPLFTPAPGTTPVTAPLTLPSVPPAPMPSKGATLYRIGIKLDLGKDADLKKSDILDCSVTVSSAGEDLVADSFVQDAQGASPCRFSDKPDDLGAFLVGTPKTSGGLSFSIKMYDVDRKVPARGSTAALPVQPGGVVEQDIVVTPVPSSH